MPDLTRYRAHKLIEDIDFEGMAVPGLNGKFYHRPAGSRTQSV